MEMLILTLLLIAGVSCLPHRERRDADVVYNKCDDVYPQCPAWKEDNQWCTSDQYREYMATVCPLTCGFCNKEDPVPDNPVAVANPETPATPLFASVPADNSQEAYQKTLQQYYANLQTVQQPEYAPAQPTPAVAVEPAAPSYQYQTYAPSVVEQQAPAVYQGSPVNPDPQSIPAVAVVNPDPQLAQAQPQPVAPQMAAPAVSDAQMAQQQQPQQQTPQVQQQPPQTYAQPGNNSIVNVTADKAPINVLIHGPLNQEENDSKPYNPKQTSSALYEAPKGGEKEKEKVVEKEITPPATVSLKQANETKKVAEDAKPEAEEEHKDEEEEATNEKIQSESKHLEKTLSKAKESRLKAELLAEEKKQQKNISSTTSKNATSDSQDDDAEDEDLASDSEKASNNREEFKSHDHEDVSGEEKATNSKDDSKSHDYVQHEGMNVIGPSKAHQKLKESSKHNSNKKSSKLKGQHHDTADKREKAATRKTEDLAAAFIGRETGDEAKRTLEPTLHRHDVTEETAEDEESGSGSGDEGRFQDALAKDLEELSFITGIDFDNDDYDVADDLSNEISQLDSKPNKKSVLNNSAHKTNTRSEIPDVSHTLTASVANEEAANSEGGASGSGEEGESGAEEESETPAVKNKSVANKQNTVKVSQTNNAVPNTPPKSASAAAPATTKVAGALPGKTASTKHTIEQGEADEEEGEDEESEDEESGTEEDSGSSSGGGPPLPAVDVNKQVDDILATSDEAKLIKVISKLDKNAEGKISFVLKQTFDPHFEESASQNFLMLSGNVKKDVEMTFPDNSVKDITFESADIEGNPRQVGKTKVSFNVKGFNKHFIAKLMKIVDEGSINGLAVVKGSLEYDDKK